MKKEQRYKYVAVMTISSISILLLFLIVSPMNIYQIIVCEKIERVRLDKKTKDRLVNQKVLPKFISAGPSNFYLVIDWDTYEHCGHFHVDTYELKIFKSNLMKNGYDLNIENPVFERISLSTLHACNKVNVSSMKNPEFYSSNQDENTSSFLIDDQTNTVYFRYP